MQHFSQTALRAGIALALIVVFGVLGWLAPIERLVLRIFSPVSQTAYDLSNPDDVGAGLSYKELQVAYEELTGEYHAKEIEAGRIAFLEEENAALRELLQVSASSTDQLLGADIIGKTIDRIGSVLLINQGTRDGVQVDQPVLSPQGTLIGVVSEVRESTAEVRRLDDNRSKIAATIFSEDKSIGVVEGLHGISLQMSFIPQNERIDVGDTVITSGLQSTIPRGIPIGRVVAVEKEPYEPFQQADIAALVNIDKLSMVGVMLVHRNVEENE